jgi:hypothetical protein
MDLHNVCFVLRRNKELFGPRSLRYRLMPGEPITIVVDPWGIEVRCPRSIYHGTSTTEIRVWGRRRLHILERLLPLADRVRVHLVGSGAPSFYVLSMGPLSFTLGLSGWTRNNWSAEGNFDLMAAREDVDDDTRARVFAELGKTWLSGASELAAKLGLAAPVVTSALQSWVQAGRAIYDLEAGVYRKRELARDPLPVDRLRFANERETEAATILHRGKVAVDEVTEREGNTRIAGRVELRTRIFATSIVLDPDRRLVTAECGCDDYVRNKLHRGPCEHMLALRAAHRRGISDKIIGEVRAARPQPTSAPTAPPPNPPAQPDAGPAPDLKKPSWWKRVVSIFSAKPDPKAPASRLRAAIAELGTQVRVSDEDALLAELLAVYEREQSENARLFALVTTVKMSAQVSLVPSDQVLIDVLRRALS